MTTDVAPGTILAGRYRVDRVLGKGGMGVVVSAHHLQLDEKVAIKFLLPEMLGHTEVVERFSREARAAVKIKSEYVARVSDVGTLETGAPYLVMEYLEGEDLSQLLKREGALAYVQAVEFVLQACEALAEAHALGIVHRDIKPANLFCVRRADGLLAAKLLDFGISKATGAADLGMTKTTAVLGSPYYMSPEQMVSSKNAGAQSDIWSLGVVLFELLSGYLPFQAETFPELVLTVAGTAAPDVSGMARDVPEGLRRVVLRCLERDRAKRYASVSELASALAPFGPPDRARASADRVHRVAMAAGGKGFVSQTAPMVQTAPAGTSRETLSTTEAASTERPALPTMIAGGETLVPLGGTANPALQLPRRSLRPLWFGAAALALGAALLAVWTAGPAEEPAASVAEPARTAPAQAAQAVPQPAELLPPPPPPAAPAPVAPAPVAPAPVPKASAGQKAPAKKAVVASSAKAGTRAPAPTTSPATSTAAAPKTTSKTTKATKAPAPLLGGRL